MDLVGDLQNMMKQLESSSNMVIDSVMKPEIMEHMTEEQKDFITNGADVIHMKGGTPSEILENATKMLKNVANVNK
jgi:hypothetical protein